MRICTIVLLAVLSLLGVAFYLFINDRLLPRPSAAQITPPVKWFGPGERQKVDESIRPFRVNVGDDALKRLKNRLAEDIPNLARPLENVGFQYGVNTEYLKEVLHYWKDTFDWRKAEASLNSFPQFLTNIDGIDIHFMHAKPAASNKKKVLPLLLVHGWPGSVCEFLKFIPMLTDTKEDFVFEVVAPSLPGYGFSSAALKEGLDVGQAARIFKELMRRLGHEKFYTQGGDWGAVTTAALAILYPETVIGHHTNFPLASSAGSLVKKQLALLLPSLFLDSEELPLVDILKDEFKNLLIETGYLHIQATKPDTLGVSLTTSPAGLAAWLLEKFGLDSKRENLKKLEGGLSDGRFTMDELLTNVMFYWVSGSGASAGRFYLENFGRSDSLGHQTSVLPVTVPTGIAVFPHEVFRAPRSVHQNRFRNIVTYNIMPKGGHFAALEQPRLLADDVVGFVKKVEATSKGNNKSEL